jgi:hypothetical protein
MPESEQKSENANLDSQAEVSTTPAQPTSVPKGPSGSTPQDESEANVSTAPSKPTAPAKPGVPPKPAAPSKAATSGPSPAPFKASPSLPLSMTNAPPESAESKVVSANGAEDEEFDRQIARFKPYKNDASSLIARLFRGFRRVDNRSVVGENRRVAFDGYRSAQHDDKLERDRRYGTVYNVTESSESYLVRLELPRRLPTTSLREVWHLDDARPVYDYSIELKHGALSIHARLHGEALRRLAYVSPSYPSGFLTRIDFAQPVTRFIHRLRDGLIEVLVFKGIGTEADRTDRDATV